MARKMRNLRPSGVAGTARPAHRHPGWLVLKSLDTEGVDSLSDEEVDAALDLIVGALEEGRVVKGGTMADEKSAEELLAEATAKLTETEARAKKAEDDLATALAKSEKPDPSKDEKPDDDAVIAKGLSTLDEPTRALVSDRLQKAQSAFDEVTALRSEREADAWMQKAERLSGLAAPSKDLASTLHSIAKSAPPEAVAEIERILTAASEAVAKSALFTEVGSGQAPDGTGDEARFESAVAQYAKDNNVPLTQAYRQVAKTAEGRDAYERPYIERTQRS